MFIKNFCGCLDYNRGTVASVVTTLPNEPQPPNDKSRALFLLKNYKASLTTNLNGFFEKKMDLPF